MNQGYSNPEHKSPRSLVVFDHFSEWLLVFLSLVSFGRSVKRPLIIFLTYPPSYHQITIMLPGATFISAASRTIHSVGNVVRMAELRADQKRHHMIMALLIFQVIE